MNHLESSEQQVYQSLGVPESENSEYPNLAFKSPAVHRDQANGNFELNTMLPVMAHNILESISILTTGTKTFTEKLIVGLEANTEKLDENIQKNSILVTALVPKLGYDTAAEIAKEAVATNNTIKKVLLEKALLSEDEIDNLLDIEKLI